MAKNRLDHDVVERATKMNQRVFSIEAELRMFYTANGLTQFVFDPAIDKPALRLDSHVPIVQQEGNQQTTHAQTPASEIENIVKFAQAEIRQNPELKHEQDIVPLRLATVGAISFAPAEKWKTPQFPHRRAIRRT